MGYAAFGFSVLYAADVSQIYVTQLGVVIPADLAGHGAKVAFAACCGSGKPATAIDLLGYTYMSLSTAVAAPIFAGPGLRQWLRALLVANGLVAPFLLTQLFWPALIYVGALWMVVFPAAMILLAQAFKSDARRPEFDGRQTAPGQ